MSGVIIYVNHGTATQGALCDIKSNSPRHNTFFLRLTITQQTRVCVCGRKDVHKTIKACPIKSAFPLFCSVVPTVHIFRSFSVLISYFHSKNILGKDFIALESSTPVLSWLAPCVVAEMKPVKEPYFTTP